MEALCSTESSDASGITDGRRVGVRPVQVDAAGCALAVAATKCASYAPRFLGDKEVPADRSHFAGQSV